MPHTVILVFELMYIYNVSNSRSKMDFMNVDFASIDKPYETLEAYFWLRLRSPRSHSVCLSVCLSGTKCSFFLFLAHIFKQTSR